jgi:hypothetical protein
MLLRLCCRLIVTGTRSGGLSVTLAAVFGIYPLAYALTFMGASAVTPRESV